MPDTHLEVVLGFLADIGIPARRGDVPADSFLPGVQIANGGLVVDPLRLRWPGDVLHEAGHIAITPAPQRAALNGALDGAEARQRPTAARSRPSPGRGPRCCTWALSPSCSSHPGLQGAVGGAAAVVLAGCLPRRCRARAGWDRLGGCRCSGRSGQPLPGDAPLATVKYASKFVNYFDSIADRDLTDSIQPVD